MKPVSAVIADFDAIADAMARERRSDWLSAERFLLRHVPPIAREAWMSDVVTVL